MTRLDRILTLLEKYDALALHLLLDKTERDFAFVHLDKLRGDKEILTKELIEHGCRRKN